jgi:hypothetical protein
MAEKRGSIRQFESKVKSTLDWRGQFRKHPAPLIALAFGGGLLLSSLFHGRPPATDAISVYRAAFGFR